MKKESLEADAWMKEVAPSTELRKWFDHRVERWDKFRQRYRDELEANPDAWQSIVDAARRGTVTLLYSAHDTVPRHRSQRRRGFTRLSDGASGRNFSSQSSKASPTTKSRRQTQCGKAATKETEEFTAETPRTQSAEIISNKILRVLCAPRR